MIHVHGLSGFSIHNNCRVCGTAFAHSNDEKICPECNFWLKIINNTPEEIEIVGDTCYRFLPYVDAPLPGAILGSEGKTFYFLGYNNQLRKSNDVWKIGRVPPRFMYRLAPTGCFIDKNLYKKISSDFFSCEAVGCYDRYHCLLYNYRLEYDTEPFNKVPLTWKVGDEHCPSFVNIAKIHGYNPIDIADII